MNTEVKLVTMINWNVPLFRKPKSLSHGQSSLCIDSGPEKKNKGERTAVFQRVASTVCWKLISSMTCTNRNLKKPSFSKRCIKVHCHLIFHDAVGLVVVYHSFCIGSLLESKQWDILELDQYFFFITKFAQHRKTGIARYRQILCCLLIWPAYTFV